MNTGGVHGSALGAAEVAAVKTALGFDPDTHFDVDTAVLAHAREVVDRGTDTHQRWQQTMDTWGEREPERFTLFSRLQDRTLPADWTDALPTYAPGSKAVATRKASGNALNAFAPVIPELWGGSADLAGSNNTTIDGADSFGPISISTKDWNAHRTGGTCTSGSASTRWARSSTASPCTARPAPTAAPSSSSPTTCAPPSGWPRS
jgi:transketolase